VVPRLASWCAVYLADDGGPPEPAYVWHCDETRRDALAALLARVAPPDVPLRMGATRWSLAGASATGLPPGAAGLASDSVWCCPLVARGRVLGAFVIGRPRGERFPREAIEMVEDLGRRAALALDNARLYSQQMQTSQALQRSLLPPEVPRVPGVDLAVQYAAAGEGNEVGGDFYDVFAVEEGRWRFSIGDVCGTGPEAAAVTGLARYTMRILARERHGLAAVLSRLNRLILDEGPRARFLTLVHGEVTTAPADPPVQGQAPVAQVSVVCAGHPPPLLMRAGHQPEPAAASQPLLGVLDEVSFHAKRLDLYSGDVLLCVTDGVTERRHAGRLLDDDDGLRRVLAGCAGLNAGAVAARIMRAVRDFAPEPPIDDTALIVIRMLDRQRRPSA
jgi:serine phosphatase RsbU (regulator of sigma subunit)